MLSISSILTYSLSDYLIVASTHSTSTKGDFFGLIMDYLLPFQSMKSMIDDRFYTNSWFTYPISEIFIWSVLPKT